MKTKPHIHKDPTGKWVPFYTSTTPHGLYHRALVFCARLNSRRVGPRS